jgi:hypothetical protein
LEIRPTRAPHYTRDEIIDWLEQGDAVTAAHLRRLGRRINAAVPSKSKLRHRKSKPR